MRGEKKFSAFLLTCLSFLVLGAALFHSAQAASNVPITGVIPLVAFNISVSAISDTSANITWKTNSQANSTVEYGTTISYGSVRTEPTMVVNRTITLGGLSRGTTYHFRVISVDQFGHVYRSTDGQFTTTGTAPTPVPSGGVGGGGYGGWSGIQPVLIPSGDCKVSSGGVSTPATDAGILTSCTFLSSVNDMTDLRSSWSVNITENPPDGARFTTYILQQPSDPARSAFDAALASQGLQITALAYVMEVVESPPIATGTETIQMDVDRSWVTRNGGVDSVRIISLGEDGLAHILETRFTNYALDSGHMNFRAVSYDDLSLYALIAVETAPVQVPVTTATIATTAVPTGTVTEAAPLPTPVPTVLLVMIVILATIIIAIGLIANMRQQRK